MFHIPSNEIHRSFRLCICGVYFQQMADDAEPNLNLVKSDLDFVSCGLDIITDLSTIQKNRSLT